jgi:hypothetical protein
MSSIRPVTVRWTPDEVTMEYYLKEVPHLISTISRRDTDVNHIFTVELRNELRTREAVRGVAA